jgi:tetratricopeptide (TPR) repeat protein
VHNVSVTELYSEVAQIIREVTCALLRGSAPLALVLVTLGSSSARAQRSDAQGYERLIHDALSEFDRGNYAEAHTVFEQAHALQPSARTLRGLGMTSFELRHYTQAQEELSAALAEKRKPLNRAQRDEVAALLERMQRYVGTIEVAVTPSDATLFVDGSNTSERRLRLDLGEYHLRAHADGYRDAELRLAVEGGEIRRLTIELRPIELDPRNVELAASPATAPSTAAPAAEGDEHGSRNVLQRWWFWTAVGALIAGGVATAVLVDSRAGTRPLEDGDVSKVITTLRVSP